MPNMINKEIDFGDGVSAKTQKPEKSTVNLKNEELEDGLKEENKILKSNIKKGDWNREVERVSGKLKLDYNNLNSYNSTEWRGHVEQIKTNDQKLAKSIPSSRSVLENLSEDISKILDKINKKESMISKNFANTIQDYKGRQKETTSQVEEFNQLRNKVDKMQKDLEELEEKANDYNVRFSINFYRTNTRK